MDFIHSLNLGYSKILPHRRRTYPPFPTTGGGFLPPKCPDPAIWPKIKSDTQIYLIYITRRLIVRLSQPTNYNPLKDIVIYHRKI